MKNNILPEEKLLRLIRKSPRKQNAPKTDVSLKNNIPDSNTDSTPHNIFRGYTRFITGGKITGIILILSGVYLTASFIYPFIGLRKITFKETADQKIKHSDIISNLDIKPFQMYIEGISGHNVFKSNISPAAAAINNESDLNSIRDITLMGIISGEKPQAIIQDNKIKKTFYINKGESAGVITVEDILIDKVIINYKGKNYELYL